MFHDPLLDGERKKKSPLLPLIGLLVMVPCGITGWYLSGSEERAKMKEAKQMIAGLGPMEITEKLFNNEKLPDVLPLDVHGVLDVRMGYYAFEYLQPYSVSAEVKKLHDLKIYGMLFPSDSSVWDERGLLESVAEEIASYQEARDTDCEAYCDLWESLAATYEDQCRGPGVLVELDKKTFPELYEQVKKEALMQVNTLGKMLHPSQVLGLHINLISRMRNPAYLREGMFRVQIVEHMNDLAAEIVSDEFTSGMSVIRTVKMMD
jgi:hypothetical protein